MDVPLLVVHDEGDREVPYSEGRRLAECWPDARLMTTNGLGHHRMLRDSEVVTATVEFVAGRASGSHARSGRGAFVDVTGGVAAS
jgi:pimeloyl-ACP methyl ester carboxylesterase